MSCSVTCCKQETGEKLSSSQNSGISNSKVSHQLDNTDFTRIARADAGAFVLAPAHPDDDVVATQFSICTGKTLPIFSNLNIEDICGVQYMGVTVRHAG